VPVTRAPRISVVVPVHNGEEQIGDCIASLLACDYPAADREILVVDNGSSDDTAAVIRSHPVTYLNEPERGVSNARNRGIAAARGEIVALLDGDCVVVPEWLAEIARPFEDPAVGCVGGELENLPPRSAAERQAERMLGRWQRFAFNSNPPYAVTANAAFRRDVFEQIGVFDPRMPRAQDVELGRRFHERSDLRLAFSPAAIALHRHTATARHFFRQQLGWAYGSGLLASRLPGEKRVPPPKLSYVTVTARGLGAVLLAFARGRGERVWLEDAWFSFLRQLAWFAGIHAGRLRGGLGGAFRT
jgi:cellulose synthase/poly-beta-1,6-N-acetylglucosamine synthase-like glycosyltransferase